LEAMRTREPPILYLVGTPKGRLAEYEKKLTELPWQAVREGVEVKLLKEEKELYVLAQSQDRRKKECGMRRRQLKWLWKRLKEIRAMKFAKKTDLAMKLGAAKQRAPSAWRLVEIEIAKSEAEPSFQFCLRTKKLREVRRREGRYLLRSNLLEEQPVQLWHLYIQLTQVEEAFKNLKGDLSLRPLFHQKESRIEAHIFVAFLAYCLHVTLRRWLRDLAPGLTPRSVLEKFSAVQMIDVHLPTTDGREVILSRYTQPEKELQLLLNQLKLQLPEQPPPKITAAGALAN
jgi:transposase